MTASITFRDYRQWRQHAGAAAAIRRAESLLAGEPPAAWEALADAILAEQAVPEAATLLERAVSRHPGAPGLIRRLAQAVLQLGYGSRAEDLAQALVAQDPSDVSALWLMADAQREQGHYGASTATVLRIATVGEQDPGDFLQCVEWMRDCAHEQLAAELCLSALRRKQEPRLLALAGQLLLVLGRFEEARRHLIDAIRAGVDQNQWLLLLALSMTQRYQDSSHPDFQLFEEVLGRQGVGALQGYAKVSAMLGLAKLHADVRNLEQCASTLRAANRMRRSLNQWSPEAWDQFVSQRITRGTLLPQVSARPGFIPVFVVGLPRSGTTLVADRLSRDARARHRGELPWIPFIDEKILAGRDITPERWKAAERLYFSRVRGDDAPALCYIDKNPANLRYLDRIASLFPQARIIWCRRNLRDTAISIYSQFFSNTANGFAADFTHIAHYARGVERLMTHWQSTLPLPIHTVNYEQLVAEPDAALNELRAFISLPATEPSATEAAHNRQSSIATASAWQARQPIYRSSIGKWRAYLDHLPELATAIPDADALG